MAYNYSRTLKEDHAKAVGRDLPISTKQSIEICNAIRGKPLKRAKDILDHAIQEEIAIPFKRFTGSVGHRRGNMASGRYVPKACQHIKDVIVSAEKNAVFKGLSIQHLFLKHISAQSGGNQHHFGRHRGRAMKRTHIEIMLAQGEKKEKVKPSAKTGKSQEHKNPKKTSSPEQQKRKESTKEEQQ